MKKFLSVLLFVIVSVFVQNIAEADYIIQRFESGVETPTYEKDEYYIRTATPQQEITNYTTNNNYYNTPYTYYPANTYKIVTPYYRNYYPYYGGSYITSGTGIHVNIGNSGYHGIKPPPPPHNTFGPCGRYEPQKPVNTNTTAGTRYVQPYNYGGVLTPSAIPSRTLPPSAIHNRNNMYR